MHQSEGDEETGDSCLRFRIRMPKLFRLGRPLKAPFQLSFHFVPLCSVYSMLGPFQLPFHFSPLCSVRSMLDPFASFTWWTHNSFLEIDHIVRHKALPEVS